MGGQYIQHSPPPPPKPTVTVGMQPCSTNTSLVPVLIARFGLFASSGSFDMVDFEGRTHVRMPWIGLWSIAEARAPRQCLGVGEVPVDSAPPTVHMWLPQFVCDAHGQEIEGCSCWKALAGRAANTVFWTKYNVPKMVYMEASDWVPSIR